MDRTNAIALCYCVNFQHCWHMSEFLGCPCLALGHLIKFKLKFGIFFIISGPASVLWSQALSWVYTIYWPQRGSIYLDTGFLHMFFTNGILLHNKSIQLGVWGRLPLKHVKPVSTCNSLCSSSSKVTCSPILVLQSPFYCIYCFYDNAPYMWCIFFNVITKIVILFYSSSCTSPLFPALGGWPFVFLVSYCIRNILISDFRILC